MRHHGYRRRAELFDARWDPHSIDRFATADNCRPLQAFNTGRFCSHYYSTTLAAWSHRRMASQCPRRAKTIGFPPPTHTHGDTPADRGDGPVRASGACGTIIAPETPWKEWWSEAPSWGSVVAAARMSSPCAMRWLGHASDCLRGRPAEPRRLAGRCAIVTCSRSACRRR